MPSMSCPAFFFWKYGPDASRSFTLTRSTSAAGIGFTALGAGSGGTMMANKMAKQLDPAEWKIIVVDRDERHFYQPGFLFIPFNIYTPADVVKPKRDFLSRGVEVVLSDIELIEPEANRVRLRSPALRGFLACGARVPRMRTGPRCSTSG